MGYFKNTTVWESLVLVTLVFLKVEGQNLVTWGILMCFLKNWHLFSNSGLLSPHYDVIIGNMEGLVTLLFFSSAHKSNFTGHVIITTGLRRMHFPRPGIILRWNVNP